MMKDNQVEFIEAFRRVFTLCTKEKHKQKASVALSRTEIAAFKKSLIKSVIYHYII